VRGVCVSYSLIGVMLVAKVAFISLSSCNGCQVTFLNLIPWVREELGAEVIACPFISKKWSGDYVDLALIEGSVGNEEHLRLVRRVRDSAKYVVAVGTCACYGGIQGLGRVLNAREVSELVPKQVTNKPVIEVVEVDAAVPRCPVPEELLKEVIKYFIKPGNEGVPTRNHAFLTVCSQCSRVMKPMKELKLRLDYDPGSIDEGTCLLSQGVLCLGPITIGGCGARCTSRGIPCSGCAGPVLDLIIIRGERPIDRLSRVIATLSGKDFSTVRRYLENLIDPVLTHTFTASSVLMRSKPNSRLLNLLGGK